MLLGSLGLLAGTSWQLFLGSLHSCFWLALRMVSDVPGRSSAGQKSQRGSFKGVHCIRPAEGGLRACVTGAGWHDLHARAQVRLISYCPKHCSAHPELSGVQIVKEGEKEDRSDLGTLLPGTPLHFILDRAWTPAALMSSC